MTMLAISERNRPCSERLSRSSSARSTSTSPSSTLAERSSGRMRESSPLGPLTVTVRPSILTSTPDGTGIGACPTRDISASPHVAEDLAAAPLGAGLPVGEQPLAGRDDGDPEAPEHAGDGIGLGVDPQARLGHPADAGDDPL